MNLKPWAEGAGQEQEMTVWRQPSVEEERTVDLGGPILILDLQNKTKQNSTVALGESLFLSGSQLPHP